MPESSILFSGENLPPSFNPENTVAVSVETNFLNQSEEDPTLVEEVGTTTDFLEEFLEAGNLEKLAVSATLLETNTDPALFTTPPVVTDRESPAGAELNLENTPAVEPTDTDSANVPDSPVPSISPEAPPSVVPDSPASFQPEDSPLNQNFADTNGILTIDSSKLENSEGGILEVEENSPHTITAEPALPSAHEAEIEPENPLTPETDQPELVAGAELNLDSTPVVTLTETYNPTPEALPSVEELISRPDSFLSVPTEPSPLNPELAAAETTPAPKENPTNLTLENSEVGIPEVKENSPTEITEEPALTSTFGAGEAVTPTVTSLLETDVSLLENSTPETESADPNEFNENAIIPAVPSSNNLTVDPTEDCLIPAVIELEENPVSESTLFPPIPEQPASILPAEPSTQDEEAGELTNPEQTVPAATLNTDPLKYPASSLTNAEPISPHPTLEPFNSGVFTVGKTGEVGFDFLYDGGRYQGQLAIFSLDGMENRPGSPEFIQEAVRRASSQSELGYIVIDDLTQGARFMGDLGEPDQNVGDYQGLKWVKMRPGSTFGVMLIPDGQLAELVKNPAAQGSKHPLFSMGTANPNKAFHIGQIADVTGDGHTYVMEDLRVDGGTDGDYNDFIFQVRGATAKTIHLDEVIKSRSDWRESELGRALVDYAKVSVEVVSDRYLKPLKPDLSEVVELAIKRAQDLEFYDQKGLEVSDQWAIWLSPGLDVNQFAKLYGAENLGASGHISDTYIWQFPEQLTAEQVQLRLQDLIGSDFAYPLVGFNLKKPQHLPDDPLVADQWHIENTGQTGGTPHADVRLGGAWPKSTGQGVIVGLVDEGVQMEHPDLQQSFKEANQDLNQDFNKTEKTSSPLDKTPPFPLIEDWWGWWWPSYSEPWSSSRNVSPPDLPEVSYPDQHGTAVAGLVAAITNNHIGVSGVAPNTSLASLRLTAAPVTDKQIADALVSGFQEIDIYNNSWKPADLHVSVPLALSAIEQGIKLGRDGKGNIYIFSAGNDGWLGGDVNYNPFANSRYTIAVGAIDHKGAQSWYSEPSASLFISAYSSSSYVDGTSIGITTTDLVGKSGYNHNGIPSSQGSENSFPITDSLRSSEQQPGNYPNFPQIENPKDYPSGNYTRRFGGTSASAPIVSGVVALMLEANPNLTWRDVQHILVETADQNDFGELSQAESSRETTTGWWQNGAGHWVNHKYGFGAIDATAAVNAASNWRPVSQEFSSTSGWINVNKSIPDYDTVGLLGQTVRDILQKDWADVTAAEKEILEETEKPVNPLSLKSTTTILENIKTEWVEVIFNATHSNRGDLKVSLISPNGTESILANQHPDSGSNYDQWVFTSARNWGESSMGNWTLQVSDEWGNEVVGEWKDWKLNIYGTVNPATVSIIAADANATEDGNAGQFIITREGGEIDQPLAIRYTLAGTATPGSDYKDLTGVVLIPAGETSVTLPLLPIKDYLLEPTETVVINLTDTASYNLGTENSASVNIANSTLTNWNPKLPIYNPGTGHFYILSEPDTWLGAQVQAEALGGYLVAINNQAEQNWLLETFSDVPNYSIGLTDSEIYGATEGNYKWLSGEPVTYTNWTPGEPNNVLATPAGEDIVLAVNSTGMWNDYSIDQWNDRPDFLVPGVIEINPATLTKPIVNITVTDAEAGEDGNLGQIVLTRIGNLDQALTVKYEVAGTARNGVDYQELTGTAIIPAGESSITLPIIPIADNELESEEKIIINLVEDAAYTISTKPSGEVTFAVEEPLWQKQLGSAADDIVNSMAVDLSGNVYTVGRTLGDLAGNNTGLSDAFITKHDSNGNEVWKNQLGTLGNDEIKDIVVDSAGNLYTIGWMGDSSNAWIAKYNPDGTQLWEKPIGTGYDIASGALAIDLNGNLYITGHTLANLEGINQGKKDAWVAKFDNAGNQEWVKQIGSSEDDLSHAITVDGTGNIYLAGYTQGALAGLPEGEGDGWVAKFKSTGELQWMQQLGTISEDIVNSIAVNNDLIYVVGKTFGELGETYPGRPEDWVGDPEARLAALGGDTSGLGGTYKGNGDGWIAQLNSDGLLNWKRLLGTANADSATQVVANNLGAYITGYTEGLLGESQFGDKDMFVALYNPEGALQWKQQLGTAGAEIAQDIALNGGGILLAGQTSGNLGAVNQGGVDIFVTKLS